MVHRLATDLLCCSYHPAHLSSIHHAMRVIVHIIIVIYLIDLIHSMKQPIEMVRPGVDAAEDQFKPHCA